jgi:hypothetical protein
MTARYLLEFLKQIPAEYLDKWPVYLQTNNLKVDLSYAKLFANNFDGKDDSIVLQSMNGHLEDY